MIKRILLLAALATMATPASAQEKPVDLAPYDAIWAQCQTTIGDGAGGWSGWHSVYEGGYSNSIELYDAGTEGVSAVVEDQFIDAIVSSKTTSCFRAENGQLAIVKTEMSGPNVASGSEDYPIVTRHGEIYFDPDGNIATNLGWIADEAGKKYALDDAKQVVARGCNEIDWRFDLDVARKQINSVLGDIEGTRPAYTPNLYDWCAEAKFPK